MVRRLAPLVGPLIAVAALCPAASAGPMSWSYRAVVEAGTGGAVPPGAAIISLGTFPTPGAPTPEALIADPATTLAWAPLPTGTSGNMDGSGTIVLASSAKSGFGTGTTVPANTVDSFRTLLE